MTPKYFKLVSSTGLIPNVLGAELRVALPACSRREGRALSTLRWSVLLSALDSCYRTHAGDSISTRVNRRRSSTPASPGK